MAKILTEYLDKDILSRYKPELIYSIYNAPKINQGEAVKFFVDTVRKKTIQLIFALLADGTHKITFETKDGTKYPAISKLDEFKYTYQSKKDILKNETYKHPILQMYEANLQEFRDKQLIKAEAARYNIALEGFDKIPDDLEIETFVRTFAKLYGLDYTTDRIEMMNQYKQLKWYLDNNIEYTEEVSGIDPDDEPMFAGIEFIRPKYEEPIEIESFGNEIYMEDYIYKNI